MPTKEQTDRFWSNVDRSGKCWVWKRFTTEKGYGKVGFSNKVQRAHRVAWFIAKGKIPNGLLVLHKCDNPPCVRPSHLFLGTAIDNTRDAMRKGRLKYKALHRIGAEHGMARLSEDDVLSIRRLCKNGAEFKSLAKLYAVSATQIWRIAHRLSWRHI